MPRGSAIEVGPYVRACKYCGAEFELPAETRGPYPRYCPPHRERKYSARTTYRARQRNGGERRG